MAIFAPDISVMTRTDKRTGAERNPIAASAYISRSRLELDARGRKRAFDYRRAHRRERVVADLGVTLPEGAPAALGDRQVLWNSLEEAERRRDARMCVRVMIPLPEELDEAQNTELARAIVKALAGEGCIVDAVVHANLDGTNPHLHALVPARKAGPGGWLPKSLNRYRCRRVRVRPSRDGGPAGAEVVGERDMTGPELEEARGLLAAEAAGRRGDGCAESWEKVYLYRGPGRLELTGPEAAARGLDPARDRVRKQPLQVGERTAPWESEGAWDRWRAGWADEINRALEEAGRPERVDHRSYEERGIVREPMRHEGAAWEAERRRDDKRASLRAARDRETGALGDLRALSARDDRTVLSVLSARTGRAIGADEARHALGDAIEGARFRVSELDEELGLLEGPATRLRAENEAASARNRAHEAAVAALAAAEAEIEAAARARAAELEAAAERDREERSRAIAALREVYDGWDAVARAAARCADPVAAISAEAASYRTAAEAAVADGPDAHLWKDDIRMAAAVCACSATSLRGFVGMMRSEFGMAVEVRGDRLLYRHGDSPEDAGRACYGERLGAPYTRWGIESAILTAEVRRRWYPDDPDGKRAQGVTLTRFRNPSSDPRTAGLDGARVTAIVSAHVENPGVHDPAQARLAAASLRRRADEAARNGLDWTSGCCRAGADALDDLAEYGPALGLIVPGDAPAARASGHALRAAVGGVAARAAVGGLDRASASAGSAAERLAGASRAIGSDVEALRANAAELGRLGGELSAARADADAIEREMAALRAEVAGPMVYAGAPNGEGAIFRSRADLEATWPEFAGGRVPDGGSVEPLADLDLAEDDMFRLEDGHVVYARLVEDDAAPGGLAWYYDEYAKAPVPGSGGEAWRQLDSGAFWGYPTAAELVADVYGPAEDIGYSEAMDDALRAGDARHEEARRAMDSKTGLPAGGPAGRDVQVAAPERAWGAPRPGTVRDEQPHRGRTR